MKNILAIDGHKSVVSFEPEIGMFRGEFLGLNGGADFLAKDIDALLSEGRKSLQVYLDLCAEKGIEPMPVHNSARR